MQSTYIFFWLITPIPPFLLVTSNWISTSLQQSCSLNVCNTSFFFIPFLNLETMHLLFLYNFSIPKCLCWSLHYPQTVMLFLLTSNETLHLYYKIMSSCVEREGFDSFWYNLLVLQCAVTKLNSTRNWSTTSVNSVMHSSFP